MPDVVGLTPRAAERVGLSAGLVVVQPDQDGPPLRATTTTGAIRAVGSAGDVAGRRVPVRYRALQVVAQHPPAGTRVERHAALTIWLGPNTDSSDETARTAPPPGGLRVGRGLRGDEVAEEHGDPLTERT